MADQENSDFALKGWRLRSRGSGIRVLTRVYFMVTSFDPAGMSMHADVGTAKIERCGCAMR